MTEKFANTNEWIYTYIRGRLMFNVGNCDFRPQKKAISLAANNSTDAQGVGDALIQVCWGIGGILGKEGMINGDISITGNISAD